ncbi:aldo/keto reductase [Phellopilus nigrolimitatus]|nr:aldo/keto reductase [Phellopilus nigrolimitatus]
MSKTTKLGSGAKEISVGKVAHGIMLMTWVPSPVPDEQAFESIKASLDSVPVGSKMIINSGEFYGMNPREANLELVARFFEKYPDYADKAFLSVKGGAGADNLNPDCSPKNLKRSVDCILAKLRGTKKLDLFECARVDRNFPIEDTIKILSGFVAEGKFDYIGMSECKAETLRRGNSVHPIAIAEIEVSPWSYTKEVKEVIATSKELGIIVCGYSPLGRGFLAGRFKGKDELEVGDLRRHLARFQDETAKHNFAIVEGLKAIAEKKGITAAQLCIAWVGSLGSHVVPLPGSSSKARTLENIAAGEIDLTPEELAAVEKVLDVHPVQGGRYFNGPDEQAHLWG